MKRRQLTLLTEDALHPFSEDIVEFMSRLRLLYEVPFSYLVTEAAVLPPESIRFFYVDPYWTDALIQGALSVGRASAQDGVTDYAMHCLSMPKTDQKLRQVRLRIMHENHKKRLKENACVTHSKMQTGFLLRSVLVRRMKGLEMIGKSGDETIEILRMEALSDEILIGIFDGELTDLVIAEPQTGLQFGCPDHTRVIKVRSVSEDGSFGTYTGDEVHLQHYTEENGKLNISQAAQEFEDKLGKKIGAAKLAFELIAVAHRAEFKKNETTDHTIMR